MSAGLSEISHENPAQTAGSQQGSRTWPQSPCSSWGRLQRISLPRDIVTLVGRTQVFDMVKQALVAMQVGISCTPFYLLQLNVLEASKNPVDNSSSYFSASGWGWKLYA